MQLTIQIENILRRRPVHTHHRNCLTLAGIECALRNIRPGRTILGGSGQIRKEVLKLIEQKKVEEKIIHGVYFYRLVASYLREVGHAVD